MDLNIIVLKSHIRTAKKKLKGKYMLKFYSNKVIK